MKNLLFLFLTLLLLFTFTYGESYNSQNRIKNLFESYHKPFVNKVYSPNNSRVTLDSKVHRPVIFPNLKVLVAFFYTKIGASVLEFTFAEMRQSHNSTPKLNKLKILQNGTRSSVKTGTSKSEYTKVPGVVNISLIRTKLFESTKTSHEIVSVIDEKILQDNQLFYYI